MLTVDRIFSLASRDARTESIPKKNNITPGQRTILDDPEFGSIKDSYDKVQWLQTKRNDIFRDMLSMQSVFEENDAKSNSSITDLTTALEQAKTDLDLLDSEIENEQSLLTNRGIIFPSNTKIEKNVKPDRSKEKSMWGNVLKKLNSIWQAIKKPLGRFTMFAVAEVFVAFLLWDILRDHKSELQTILRIAASAVIFATLHFAEIKYKKNGRWWDVSYIIFAWLSAVVLLFGSIIIVSAFPEALDTAPSIEKIFDLNATDAIASTKEGSTFLSSYVRYDFLIAVVCLLIFMLISILDKNNPQDKKVESENIESNKEKDAPNPVFVPLINLYTLRNTKAKEVTKLGADIENIESKPTNLAYKIDQNLQSKREEIEVIDKDLSTLLIIIEKQITEVESKLKQYAVDYSDVFKNNVASSFEKPEWIEKAEILNYYNIKNI